MDRSCLPDGGSRRIGGLWAYDAWERNTMQLRVSYIPQVPMQPFYKEVDSVPEALLVANTLIEFSSFEYAENVKPDYSDAIDLEVFEDGEWVTFLDGDGKDLSELMEV